MVSARSSVTPCATPCATQMRAHRCIGLAQSAQPSPKKLKVLGEATNRIAVEPAGVDKEEEVAINEEVAAAVEELAPLPVYEDGPTRQCPISDPVLLGVDFLQEGIELIQSIHSAAGTSPQQKSQRPLSHCSRTRGRATAAWRSRSSGKRRDSTTVWHALN